MKAPIFIAVFSLLMIASVSASCWDDWSRCSGWSMGLGGILWLKCNDYCVCLGYKKGNCVDVKNTCNLLPPSAKISQCRCQQKVKKGRNDCGL